MPSRNKRRALAIKRAQQYADQDARTIPHLHRNVLTKRQAHQGRALRKLRQSGNYSSGQHFETDGKTLGFMDANMREHRVQMSVTPRMPNWVRKDTAKDARNGIYHL